MLGAQLPLISALPFVALLTAIAVGPLVAPHWWHSNRNKALVAGLVALPVLIHLGVALGEPGRVVLAERVHEYIGFIVVIAALFVITGGIHIEGSLSGTPLVNTGVLGIGAVLANLAGTTGTLLAVFNVWDQVALNREERERRGSQLERVMVHEPLRVRGGVAAAALVGVLLTIISAGRAAAGGRPWASGVQEAIIVALALIAYHGTAEENRAKNAFTFGPIVEVGVLFAAIFVTMAPVLEILNAWSQGARTVLGMGFGVTHPWEFFWATGSLSSVLDNAPTY